MDAGYAFPLRRILRSAKGGRSRLPPSQDIAQDNMWYQRADAENTLELRRYSDNDPAGRVSRTRHQGIALGTKPCRTAGENQATLDQPSHNSAKSLQNEADPIRGVSRSRKVLENLRVAQAMLPRSPECEPFVIAFLAQRKLG